MIRFLILIVLIISSYANYKVFQSFIVQTKVIGDYNSGNLREENLIRLNNLDINYPNISATAFPLKEIKAMYELRFGDYSSALDMLNNGIKGNPYMRVNESLKAEAFYNLGMRDSSYFYSKIAYENLPGNARHYQQYLTELVFKKDLDEIMKVFTKSKFKNNSQYWINYFASVIKLSDGNNEIDSLARLAIKKFPNNEKIRTISAYIIHGQENVKKSYELFKCGIEHFSNNNFNKASEKFIEAIDLNKMDYSFYENAGMSLIKAKRNEEATAYFYKAINNFDTKDGKSEYGLATALSSLNQKNEACKYFLKSMKRNFKPAFKDYSILCK